MSEPKIVGLAAEFHKDSREKLQLSSLWVRREKVSRHDGKAYIWADGYDVDWSKTFQSYVFHNSSSGFHVPEVSGIYFLSGDMKVKERPCALVDPRDNPPWKSKRTRVIRERNRTRRLKRLPKAFDMEGTANLLEWLQNNGIEAGATYCCECNDWLPEDADDLCEHVWWCSKTRVYSNPDERCVCNDRDECDGKERQ